MTTDQQPGALPIPSDHPAEDHHALPAWLTQSGGFLVRLSATGQLTIPAPRRQPHGRGAGDPRARRLQEGGAGSSAHRLGNTDRRGRCR